jgi:hypothetical protein
MIPLRNLHVVSGATLGQTVPILSGQGRSSTGDTRARPSSSAIAAGVGRNLAEPGSQHVLTLLSGSTYGSTA